MCRETCNVCAVSVDDIINIKILGIFCLSKLTLT